MPRSPCNASAGCRKNDGVPVLESVAEIFLPTIPDLPIPATTTRLLHAKKRLTALSNVESRRARTSWIACASMRRTRRAVSWLIARPTSEQGSKVLSCGREEQEVARAGARWRHRRALSQDCHAFRGTDRPLPRRLPRAQVVQ